MIGPSSLTREQGEIEQRAYRYPGCPDLCFRWFIVTDKVPMPYYSLAEARAEWLAKQRAAFAAPAAAADVIRQAAL